MTLDEIKARVKEIEDFSGDDELAHSMEDTLRAEFIEYITTHEDQLLAEKAEMILTTDKIEFSRWCA